MPGSPTLTGFQDQRPSVEHPLQLGGECGNRTHSARSRESAALAVRCITILPTHLNLVPGGRFELPES